MTAESTIQTDAETLSPFQIGVSQRDAYRQACDEANLNEAQRESLGEVIRHKDALERALQEVKYEVDEALADGRRVRGSGGIGYGPIGHQAPFEVATRTAQLDDAIKFCYRMGIQNSLIQRACELSSI